MIIEKLNRRWPIKSVIKALLRAVTISLPWGAREAIFDALCERRGRYASLSDLAQQLGIESFIVAGKYGLMQSSCKDCSILAVYAANGSFADRSNTLLTAFFGDAEPGTYIDIGANIGMTTIPVAQNLHVNCIAVEPEPINFANLAANVARNCPHGNVSMRQLAIFSEPASLKLEVATGNLGDHRLRLSDAVGALEEQARRVVTVDAVPLDSLVDPDNLAKLAVKIDVQGAEPFVGGIL